MTTDTPTPTVQSTEVQGLLQRALDAAALVRDTGHSYGILAREVRKAIEHLSSVDAPPTEEDKFNEWLGKGS